MTSHGVLTAAALLTIAAVLVTRGRQLFPEHLTADVFGRAPWLIVDGAFAVAIAALVHLIWHQHQRPTSSAAVTTLTQARALAGELLVGSSLTHSPWHQEANRPLAALVYALTRNGTQHGATRAASLTLGLCDPHNDDAWSELVEVILRADIHLCQEVYPIACWNGYQRARVGVVMHEAVLLWGRVSDAAQ